MDSQSHINTLSNEDFVKAFETLYEHSPWVVETAATLRPFQSIKHMQAAFDSVIYGADAETQTTLIIAHPDLAAKLDQMSGLTEFSQAEQSRAGFAALPQETFERLRAALGAYRERFGHPFVLCVTEHSAEEVLPILQIRSKASPDSERLACLAQITRIGWHRLMQIVSNL